MGFFFFSSRRRHTRFDCDWSSDVCSSDLCVLLAWKDGQPVGCAALRQVDAQTGEMKRVYVRPTVRSENLGRRLVEGILDAARHAGYTRICLDEIGRASCRERV